MEDGHPENSRSVGSHGHRQALTEEKCIVREKTVAMRLPVRCRRPRCQGEAKCFGLCRSCYYMAWLLVSKGMTTWEELRRTGRIDEPKRGATKDWLLGK
jgi:hypothetical protein